MASSAGRLPVGCDCQRPASEPRTQRLSCPAAHFHVASVIAARFGNPFLSASGDVTPSLNAVNTRRAIYSRSVASAYDFRGNTPLPPDATFSARVAWLRPSLRPFTLVASRPHLTEYRACATVCRSARAGTSYLVSRIGCGVRPRLMRLGITQLPRHEARPGKCAN